MGKVHRTYFYTGYASPLQLRDERAPTLVQEFLGLRHGETALWRRGLRYETRLTGRHGITGSPFLCCEGHWGLVGEAEDSRCRERVMRYSHTKLPSSYTLRILDITVDMLLLDSDDLTVSECKVCSESLPCCMLTFRYDVDS